MRDYRHKPDDSRTQEEKPSGKLPNLRFCKHCGAHNDDSGQCVICYKSLGSLRMALIAGLVCTLLYGLFWVLLTVLTKMQLPILAIIYGAMVSLGVDYYSRGRGILFQLIANVLTIAGIVFFDVLALELTEHLAGSTDITDLNMDEWIEKLKHGLFYDDLTIFFACLGVAGGFWLWRSNGSYSE